GANSRSPRQLSTRIVTNLAAQGKAVAGGRLSPAGRCSDNCLDPFHLYEPDIVFTTKVRRPDGLACRLALSLAARGRGCRAGQGPELGHDGGIAAPRGISGGRHAGRPRGGEPRWPGGSQLSSQGVRKAW